MSVYKAINAVQAALSKIGIAKDKQAQGYKFRGIDDVYNAISPLLAEHGLCILPRITCLNPFEIRASVQLPTRNFPIKSSSWKPP